MKRSSFYPALIILLLTMSAIRLMGATADTINNRTMAEDTIWNLETAYFENLYKANYEAVLTLVDEGFLGWPGGLSKPITRNESAAFMKKLIPSPTSNKIRIEKLGISIVNHVALTQYLLFVESSNNDGELKSSATRICHTWIQTGGKWKLLGGTSNEQ